MTILCHMLSRVSHITLETAIIFVSPHGNGGSGTFSHTFSEQNLHHTKPVYRYLTLILKALDAFLRYSEMVAILENGPKWPPQPPQGESGLWLGTIAKFTYFCITYNFAKFDGFSTAEYDPESMSHQNVCIV